MATVFIDLDGTLTDPKPGITRSIRHALHRLGRDAPGEDALTWCIGPPLISSFEKLLGDAELARRALVIYRERYAEIGLFENRVYDRVPQMLTRLRDAGFRLYLATSKPHVYAARITAHFGFDDWLDGLFGSELDGTRGDKSALLHYALAETDTGSDRAFMLGDRKHDVIGARNNGVSAVGALWGFAADGELQAAGVAHLAANSDEAADLSAVA